MLARQRGCEATWHGCEVAGLLGHSRTRARGSPRLPRALHEQVGVTFELSDYVRPLSQDGYFSMRLRHIPDSPGVKLVTPFERVEKFDTCVWITRDPLATLVSHYTYILDGGEHQVWRCTSRAPLSPTTPPTAN